MPNKHAAKTAVPSSIERHRHEGAGAGGISFAPPAYGIACLDQMGSTGLGTGPSKDVSGSATQLMDDPGAVAGSMTNPNRTGMPDKLKSGIEALSGMAMDNVRVHYNSPKPPQLQALAYAQGTDIHLAPGQERHLPHEAWHVVQQAQGRVKPTASVGGVQINDSQNLEAEADRMGDIANSL